MKGAPSSWSPPISTRSSRSRDRILVIYRGRIVADLDADETDVEEVGRLHGRLARLPRRGHESCSAERGRHVSTEARDIAGGFASRSGRRCIRPLLSPIIAILIAIIVGALAGGGGRPEPDR